jgi:membrane protein required for colicin V production
MSSLERLVTRDKLGGQDSADLLTTDYLLLTTVVLTLLDYLVIGVTALSLVFGLVKGFVRSILGLAVAIAGLLAAANFYTAVAPVARPYVETDLMAKLTAFLLIFLIIVFAGIAAGRVFRKALEKTHLSWVDHLMGGAFGFLRGWLVCSVIYVALTAFPEHLSMVQRATLAPYLLKGAQIITYLTSSEVRERFFREYHLLQQRWGNKNER